MFTISKAGIADIETIRQIANATWPHAYGAILTPGQIDYMLNMMYSSASLSNQMESGHRFILLHHDGNPAAFAAYAEMTSGQRGVYRLHKLYVMPAMQGKGAGRLMLDHIIAEITGSGAVALELNVNRNNRAFHFYSMLGFTVTREEDIDIGNGYYMNDYVMTKQL